MKDFEGNEVKAFTLYLTEKEIDFINKTYPWRHLFDSDETFIPTYFKAILWEEMEEHEKKEGK